jgi:hypothetical protein
LLSKDDGGGGGELPVMVIAVLKPLLAVAQ